MKIKMICLTAIFLLTGCSYGMDMLERAITDRASFSINAAYDSGNLKISWSESPSSDCFAGYEVYIIPEPWNEYGTYEVMAARYTISSAPFFDTTPGVLDLLGKPETKSVNINVSPFVNPNGYRDEYYVRLGIIKMYKDDSDECIKPDSRDKYIRHSSLDKISGYKAVSIY